MEPQRGPGLFVTLEGIDGAGKSTQIAALAAHLGARGREAVETREPGGAPGAEAIRRLLLEGEPGRWSPVAEALLFTAARRDHVERLVRPALERGAVVLCDRYVDSTRAYQGGDPAIARLIETLHAEAIGLEADLTLLLDIDPAAAAERAARRGEADDRFERRGRAFQEALRARFLALAAAHPARIRVIDAARPRADVAAEIADAVDRALAAR